MKIHSMYMGNEHRGSVAGARAAGTSDTTSLRVIIRAIVFAIGPARKQNAQIGYVCMSDLKQSQLNGTNNAPEAPSTPPSTRYYEIHRSGH
jgi:hypothetical protein